MSNKSVKKSAAQKKWLSNRRDRRTIIAPEYHLIITEGTKTEPYYFEGLKREVNRFYQNRISLVIQGVGQGENTLSLLDYAQNYVKKDPDKYKHVWLVYDKDDFPKDRFDNTFYKCQSISQNSPVVYHALWSNECIELWFLLHFATLDVALHRKEYYPKLTGHLGFQYEKNCDNIYAFLRPILQTAINNAKKIRDRFTNVPPSKCNPATTVYEIFEYLKFYLQ